MVEIYLPTTASISPGTARDTQNWWQCIMLIQLPIKSQGLTMNTKPRSQFVSSYLQRERELVYHDRVVDAPVSESQPNVVNPHPQLSQTQTYHLKWYQLLTTGERGGLGKMQNGGEGRGG